MATPAKAMEDMSVEIIAIVNLIHLLFVAVYKVSYSRAIMPAPKTHEGRVTNVTLVSLNSLTLERQTADVQHQSATPHPR